MSPLFALNQARDAPLPSLTRAWLLFAGPFRAGLLDQPPAPHCFLTLGVYNFVAFAESEAACASIRDRLTSLSPGMPWETWVIENGLVLGHSSSESPYGPIPGELKIPLAGIPAPLTAPAREYSVLVATAIARSKPYLPALTATLERFARLFGEALMNEDSDLGRERLLVLANAALSRQSSQTYAGISPVMATECHYWTHSLLGIGTATAAIHNVYSFVLEHLARSNIPKRLALLDQVPPYARPLQGLVTTDPFWARDHLAYNVQANADASIEEILPQITCFSGRDGFRSTRVSISVPLETLSSCNAVSWTLRTFTHELSHLVIDGVMSVVLPDIDDHHEIHRLAGVIDQTLAPQSLLDQVKGFVLTGIWSLIGRRRDQAHPATIVRRYKHDAAELLTHAFDYLYFYEGGPQAYVESLWASWGVIPNIEHRAREYVLRTAATLYLNHLETRGGDMLALEQARASLEEIAVRHPSLPYVTAALRYLGSERRALQRDLAARVPLLRFARHFLYSPSLAAPLIADPDPAGGQSGLSYQPLNLPYESVRNPLRFINMFSNEAERHNLRSAWILHLLAFAESQSVS